VIPLPKPFGFQITKFMILELLAAVLIAVIYIPIARRARTGELPKGAWWNAFEALLTFIRNDVVRPTIGEKYTDKYVPFFWTLFLFLLFNNLLGLFPRVGRRRGGFWLTAGVALCAFILMHGASMADGGPGAYLKPLGPHMEIAPRRGGRAGHGAPPHDRAPGQEHVSARGPPAEP